LIEIVLQVIKNNIFSSEDSIEIVPICSVHRYSATVEEVFHYYNVYKEEKEEDKDPRNVKMQEIEGEHTVEGP